MNKIFYALQLFGIRNEPTRITLRLMTLSLAISLGSVMGFPLIWEWAQPAYYYVCWIPLFILGFVMFRELRKLDKWAMDNSSEVLDKW